MIHVYYTVILILRPAGRSHELLMAKRAAGKYMGDTWQLIAGGLEDGETAWQCALREMREETGLVPTEFYRLSTLTQFYRPGNDSLNLAPMFCAVVPADAHVETNHENSDVRWVTIEDAAGHLMWPSDLEALDEVRRVILGNAAAKPYMRIPVDGGPTVSG